MRDGPRNRRSSLSWKQIMSMAMNAAAGVVHLHRENVIHRDLACRVRDLWRDGVAGAQWVQAQLTGV